MVLILLLPLLKPSFPLQHILSITDDIKSEEKSSSEPCDCLVELNESCDRCKPPPPQRTSKIQKFSDFCVAASRSNCRCGINCSSGKGNKRRNKKELRDGPFRNIYPHRIFPSFPSFANVLPDMCIYCVAACMS